MQKTLKSILKDQIEVIFFLVKVDNKEGALLTIKELRQHLDSLEKQIEGGD